MVLLKSDINRQICLREKEYLSLIEDHIMMQALKEAGIEDLPIYKAAKSILLDGHIEVHIKPVPKCYK